MPNALTGISSMATKTLLAELATSYANASGRAVAIESIGGATAADRLRAGEVFDFAVLARNAMEDLAAEGFVRPESLRDVALSAMAVAVRTGEARPDISSEESVRACLETASSIGYSTGPSGKRLLALLKQWNLLEAAQDRLVLAPPGFPVARLVAEGKAAVGIQQLSEFVGVAGVAIVGELPDAIQSITAFTGGVVARARDPDGADAFLRFLISPAAVAARRAHGLR